MYRDLWTVVNSVKRDMNLATDAYDLTFYKYATDELRELILAGLADALVFKTVKLDVVDNCAVLPVDYSTWLKVGAEHCGNILYFAYNAELFKLPKTCCTDTDFENCCNDFDSGGLNSQYYAEFWQNSMYYHNNQITAGVYGATANINYGEFNIDLPNRRIILGHGYRSRKHVMLQYRSNGLGEGINGVVTDDMLEAIVNGVHWRRLRFKSEDDKDLRQLVPQARRERVISWERVLARKSALTAEEFLDLYRHSITGVPKR